MSDLKLDEFQPTPEASTPADGLERSAADLAAVYDVPVHIQAVLGRANVEVASLLRLNRGSVIELDRNRNNVVLSRRAYLEEEQAEHRQAFLDDLAEGDIRDGTVSSVVNFGAFVDLGGMDGLVHVSELS